jgi:hypothetical protein
VLLRTQEENGSGDDAMAAVKHRYPVFSTGFQGLGQSPQ